MAEVKVALAYVHGDANRVSSFEDSIDALVAFDQAHDGVLAHPAGRMPVRMGTDGLPAARNAVAQKVIESDVDWVFIVDTDMGFAPATLYQLLAVADAAERPVVGGLCFASRQFAHDGMSGYRTRPSPTIYDWIAGEDGVPRFTSVPMYPVNRLVQVAGTGAACILVHRSVFERIAERFGPTWYDRTPGTDGKLLGEDISFCVRCSALGIPLFVHTGIRTTHYKAQWLSEVDHWMRYVPPPAEQPVAVLVRAPGNDFNRSLRASTGLAEVCTDPAATTADWFFLTSPTARFRPGWLDHAEHVAAALDASVIGVNNPLVEQEGDLASSVLVARAYVDEFGTDTQAIIAAAQDRGDWAMALGAIVEEELPEPVEWTVPRYAIIPTHNRPELLTALVASLGRQCDRIVVLDNASEPPVAEEQLQTAAGIPVLVLRDEEQPPNLARFWNVMFEQAAEDAKGRGVTEWDVAVLNDDSIVPAGWFNACSTGLRGHDSAVIAHTSPTSPPLLTELHNTPGNRMTPHAFVIRGELGMRADERMKWWYQDSDLDLRARLAGGVLSVKGPAVVNSKANQTTVGFLAGQAQADHAVFAAKWSQ